MSPSFIFQFWTDFNLIFVDRMGYIFGVLCARDLPAVEMTGISNVPTSRKKDKRKELQ
jgi:hypothetical protein